MDARSGRARGDCEASDRTAPYFVVGFCRSCRGLIHQALERRAEPPAPVIIHTRSLWTNVWLAIIAFCLLAILGTLWIRCCWNESRRVDE